MLFSFVYFWPSEWNNIILLKQWEWIIDNGYIKVNTFFLYILNILSSKEIKKNIVTIKLLVFEKTLNRFNENNIVLSWNLVRPD